MTMDVRRKRRTYRKLLVLASMLDGLISSVKNLDIHLNLIFGD